MPIDDQALIEFMTLYKAEFGKDISRQDAHEMAGRLIHLYQIVYRPLPGETSDGRTP